MLRIKPTSDCIIQKLDCSTGDWVDWFDASCAGPDIVRQAVSEAHGTILQPIEENPPESGSGDCVEYDLVMPANQQTLLPIRLDAGDTVQITAAKGAITDGNALFGLSVWYWPSGDAYRGLPGEIFDPGSAIPADQNDPLQTANHMRLIANVGGVWYDAFDTTITIPSGTAQDNLIFMSNDSTLDDNSGTWRFHVKVCKSTGGFYAHTFNFATSDNGWVNNTNGGQRGIYVLGSGWESSDGTSNNSHNFTGVNIYMPLAAQVDIDSVEFFFNANEDASADSEFLLFGAGTGLNNWRIQATKADLGNGPVYDKKFTITGWQASTALELVINAAESFGSLPPASCLLTKIIARGPGSDPF